MQQRFSQRRRLTLAAGLALAPLLTLTAGQAPASEPGTPDSPLQWVAGDLPPFAWISTNGPQGYAHELAIRMAQRLGRPLHVSYYPWARAVKMAKEGDHYGIFPLARTPDREQQFRWLIPLMTVRYAFVGRAGKTPQTLDQLRSQRIGVLRGSPIIRNLQAERFSQIVEAKDYKDLLRLLQMDAITAIYAGAPMLQAAIDEYGFERGLFQTHTTLGEATLYMGASLKVSDAEAERWTKAYQQLQADGTVARLQQRYLRP
jgi:polar amino acid transport system substrate-binding protein